MEQPNEVNQNRRRSLNNYAPSVPEPSFSLKSLGSHGHNAAIQGLQEKRSA
jgi:hypothetical protein